MARTLVDVQLHLYGSSVAEMYTTSADPSDPAELPKLLAQAKTRHGVDDDDYTVRVWNAQTSEELFT